MNVSGGGFRGIACRTVFLPSSVRYLSAIRHHEKEFCSFASIGGDGGASGGHGRLTGEEEGEDGSSPRKSSAFATGVAALVVSNAMLLWSIKSDCDLLDFREGPQVSIVVPALNEAAEGNISECIQHLRSLTPPPHEIIVVDGGSVDGTRKLAKKAGADKVMRSPRGRARQQNHGVFRGASGEYVLFVHADSRPPLDAIMRVREMLARPAIILGGFKTVIERKSVKKVRMPSSSEDGNMLLFATLHNFLSTYYAPAFFRPLAYVRGLKCLFGDQSLFCRRRDFVSVGGYNMSLPIMEDVDLCVRLHEYGVANHVGGRQVQVLKGEPNRTSGRRIASYGSLKATYIQFRLALAWLRGVDPDRLCDLYNEIYTDNFRGL